MKPVLTQRFALGECPRWDEKNQMLWWVDILNQQLHGLDSHSGEHLCRQFSEEIGCFSLRKSGGFILAGRSGFWLIDSFDGELQHIYDPESDFPNQRFNDGRCDSDGRFIAGTMNPNKDESYGQFYQMGSTHHVSPLIGRSWTCNGLAFSPDGRTLYWSDTPQRSIYQCDYDPSTGKVANQRLFYQVPDEKGRPDGASIDSKGNYWSALYGGGEILCISPNGILLHELQVPVTNPTMVAFGGKNLQTMYITSANQKLSEKQLMDNPLEGSLLSCEAPYPGCVESRFAG
jgi:sugar lactone lactonase YvrE